MSAPHERGYETTDARTGVVVVAVALLALTLLAVSFGARKLLGSLERGAGRRDLPAHARPGEVAVPGPQLQASPARELAEHRALERSRTSEYAWVDREAGLVRIPVERALELLVERGLPAREGGPTWDELAGTTARRASTGGSAGGTGGSAGGHAEEGGH